VTDAERLAVAAGHAATWIQHEIMASPGSATTLGRCFTPQELSDLLRSGVALQPPAGAPVSPLLAEATSQSSVVVAGLGTFAKALGLQVWDLNRADRCRAAATSAEKGGAA